MECDSFDWWTWHRGPSTVRAKRGPRWSTTRVRIPPCLSKSSSLPLLYLKEKADETTFAGRPQKRKTNSTIRTKRVFCWFERPRYRLRRLLKRRSRPPRLLYSNLAEQLPAGQWEREVPSRARWQLSSWTRLDWGRCCRGSRGGRGGSPTWENIERQCWLWAERAERWWLMHFTSVVLLDQSSTRYDIWDEVRSFSPVWFNANKAKSLNK